MSKAILNGVVIDTENYQLEGGNPEPTDKTKRGWTIFLCVALILVGSISCRMPTWLGLAKMSDFGPVGVRIVCELYDSADFVTEIDEVRDVYPGYDFDYARDGKQVKRDFDLLPVDFLGYTRSVTAGTIYYGIYVDKDTLSGIIESCEDENYKKNDLSALLDIFRTRPYTDRELVEVLVAGRPDNAALLKDLMEYDVVSGMRFIYQWPAEYNRKITRIYDKLIGEKLSFAQVAYAMEIVITAGALLISLVVALILNAIISAFSGVADEDDDFDWDDKSDSEYFSRGGYRTSEDFDDEDDEDEDEYDDEEGEDEDDDEGEDERRGGRRRYAGSSAGATAAAIIIRH